MSTILGLAPATFWGLFAAVPAVVAELIYKKWPPDWPWWYGLPAWLPIQLMIGYGIFKLVTGPSSGSLMDAFVIWAFSTTVMRVAVSMVILGETVKGGTLFALALLIMARVAQTFWGR